MDMKIGSSLSKTCDQNVAPIKYSLTQPGRLHTHDGRVVTGFRKVGRHFQLEISGTWVTVHEGSNLRMDKVYTRENWAEFIAAENRGEQLEVDEDIFDYFLEVLPPVYMYRTVELPNGTQVRTTFGFAEGAEPVTAFWKLDGRYFCQRTKEMNPRA